MYVVRMLRKHLQRKNLYPILWIANVPMAYLMNKIPCSLRIFDAIDDWEHIPDLRSNLRIRECYEIINQHADIIFTVSEYLAAKFKKRASARLIRHVPNGVDLELFSYAATPPTVRIDNRRQRQPVLTYVGILSNRFDFTLTEALANAFPHCKLLLVGPLYKSEESKFKRLQVLPNVEWRGLVHHIHIPKIIRDSDVLLIPHCTSPLATSMDPLKLYEYMTTGLPIVATDIPPMKKYAQLIYIAKNHQAFIEYVGKALQEQEMPNAEWMWKKRLEEAKKHSWEERVQRILEDIIDVLTQRTQS
jgi:glycosyltransferase involved in cell wall biosynthesis